MKDHAEHLPRSLRDEFARARVIDSTSRVAGRVRYVLRASYVWRVETISEGWLLKASMWRDGREIAQSVPARDR